MPGGTGFFCSMTAMTAWVVPKDAAPAEAGCNYCHVGGNFADDRGNAFASIGWTENGRLNQDQRPYGVRAIGAIPARRTASWLASHRACRAGQDAGNATTAPECRQ